MDYADQIYFSDDGAPVLAEPAAPDRAMTETDALEDCLLQIGAPVTPASMAALETLLEQIATRRAAEAVAVMMTRLEVSAAGVALRRVVCGDHGQTERQAATEAQCSQTAIQKQERKIRARLAGGCHAGHL